MGKGGSSRQGKVVDAKAQGFYKHSIEKLGSQCGRRIEVGTF